MVAKRKHGTRKWIVLASIVLLVVAGGYGGYRYYSSRNADTKSQVASEAKKEVDELGLLGDNELAARYVTYLKANQSDKAQKLFIDKIAVEQDEQKKIDLFVQNIQLALFYKHTDEALEAALRAAEAYPRHDVYMQVATVYVAKRDTGKQIEYVQKAIDALNASSDEDKDALRAIYEQKLRAAQEVQALGLDK